MASCSFLVVVLLLDLSFAYGTAINMRRRLNLAMNADLFQRQVRAPIPCSWRASMDTARRMREAQLQHSNVRKSESCDNKVPDCFLLDEVKLGQGSTVSHQRTMHPNIRHLPATQLLRGSMMCSTSRNLPYGSVLYSRGLLKCEVA